MKPKQAKPEKSGASYDSCQTPPHAILPLLYYINPAHYVIWESAAGEGILAEAFRSHGYEVYASDYIHGQDFFEHKPPPHINKSYIQVTNPPYSIKYKWIQRSYEVSLPFALLMPLETLGAAKAQKFFKVTNMQMIVFSKRINFKMPNLGWEGKGAQFPVAWFTWGLQLPRDILYWDVDKQEHLW